MLTKQDQEFIQTAIVSALKENNIVFKNELKKELKDELKKELKKEWREDMRDLIQENNVLIKGYIEQSAADTKQEIRAEIYSCISASESRTNTKIDRVHQELRDFRFEMAEFMTERIIPRIYDLQDEVTAIKKHANITT
jgi:gas vesicle protein